MNACKVGGNHLCWKTVANSPRYVRRVIAMVILLTGTYYLQTNRVKFRDVLCSMLIGNSSTSWSTVLIDVNVVVYYKSLVLLSLPIFTILKMSNCKKLIGPLCVHRSYHQNVKESLRLIYILYTKSQHHVKRINSHNYNSSCAHTPRQVNMFF